MPNTAEKLMSLDEFLAWEREQPERYEYAGGVVTMITGRLGCACHDRVEPWRSAAPDVVRSAAI
jgi:hypothetical protein